MRLSRIYLLALALVVLSLAACDGGGTLSASPPAGSSLVGQSQAVGVPSPVNSGPPLAVVGTENFYADLLTQIGGPRVRATSFLNDPNADPHAFESSPKQASSGTRPTSRPPRNASLSSSAVS
jgi:zinc/manganese transport system substrate-binding protein